jgi:hypothetical protein
MFSHIENLMGFRAFPRNWGIDWDLFFPISAKPAKYGVGRLQPSYKIDTSLVNMLGNLPGGVGSNPPSLAARNLLRGWRAGLPSGQAVARAMGLMPVADDLLTVGPATEIDRCTNIQLVKVSPSFRNNAPLWYYILAEAQQQFINNATPIRLGPVGGRIVGEVLVGLMLADKYSFLCQDPLFKPLPTLCSAGCFTFSQLLRAVMC